MTAKPSREVAIGRWMKGEETLIALCLVGYRRYCAAAGLARLLPVADRYRGVRQPAQPPVPQRFRLSPAHRP
jgi:hypothetical protein